LSEKEPFNKQVILYQSGITIAYTQPDDFNSLVVSHFYPAATKENENSSVTCLKWSPDYKALCVLYDNGTFSLFSVFGTLLYNSKDQLCFTMPLQTQHLAKTIVTLRIYFIKLDSTRFDLRFYFLLGIRRGGLLVMGLLEQLRAK